MVKKKAARKAPAKKAPAKKAPAKKAPAKKAVAKKAVAKKPVKRASNKPVARATRSPGRGDDQFLKYSGKFTVRLPKSLHQALVDRAEREGVSLNLFVTNALSRTVAAKK